MGVLPPLPPPKQRELSCLSDINFLTSSLRWPSMIVIRRCIQKQAALCKAIQANNLALFVKQQTSFKETYQYISALITDTRNHDSLIKRTAFKDPHCSYSIFRSRSNQTLVKHIKRSFHQLPVHQSNKDSFSDSGKLKQEKMPPLHPSVINRLASIEDSLRFHGYSTIRWGVVLLGVTGINLIIELY